ncbi:MAG TPA: proline dehydrogenase [Marinilabiliales bacterium]|nr:MAG: proline dehydrogenase [Bacteroidetes bacterium GWC2_40_13]OFX70955.1 MAG: proline dehydrogenase [Bacteroidetes bacterium GWD2_40_43]OFX88413.1 MAG: proline dehydrogenase [Bacteroidetes bacterium GWE2_40_63]OFY23366.1 MAG: proline dehydrogenase [Bacteroidetes bacterium GWF2_40_13]OFZ29614.1 MAG: proline dehydrogenase [Bacteroidetes bacterium RIFOXYC2_FULL_40_12]HAN00283.1 proline dehydrogenase [Marinilabiliales bacterium]
MFNKMIAAMLPYMPKKLIWIFSKRYIAGVTIDDAIRAARYLNQKGMVVTMDILGEFIKTLEEAEKNRYEYLNLLDVIEKEKIDGNVSLKPSMFGLLLDEEVCFQHLHAIVAKAASHNNFIRVDMEDSPCTTKTINIYRRLKAEFPNNCGLVVQAYMKRTLQDVTDLLDIHTPEIPLNYRLCKGIYVEPAEIAYKKYEEINQHYLEDLEFMFQKGIYPGIATHDRPLVEGAYRLIEKYNVPKDKYEFQMLYGVTPDLRQSIVDRGHKMRVYVPYGKQWFGYSTRRLKENPKMASHIIKALFVRG